VSIWRSISRCVSGERFMASIRQGGPGAWWRGAARLATAQPLRPRRAGSGSTRPGSLAFDLPREQGLGLRRCKPGELLGQAAAHLEVLIIRVLPGPAPDREPLVGEYVDDRFRQAEARVLPVCPVRVRRARGRTKSQSSFRALHV